MTGFSRLLVPLDGSTLAENALLEMELLVRAGAKHVTLVRVVGSSESEGDAAAYLEQVVEHVRARQLEAELRTCRGVSADQILAEVARSSADIIVMTTHGRSGLGRWVYGSTAQSVLARTDVPILLGRAWHRNDTRSPVERVPAARVLVPLDGSPFGEAMLPIAAALARGPLAAELVLLRVVLPVQYMLTSWVPGVVYSDLGREVDQDDAQTYLDAMRGRVEHDYGVPPSQVRTRVRVGLATDSVLESASELGCELVTMTTHGRSGIGRAVMGSVADGVLRRGEVPLLLVRPTCEHASRAVR